MPKLQKWIPYMHINTYTLLHTHTHTPTHTHTHTLSLSIPISLTFSIPHTNYKIVNFILNIPVIGVL